MQQILSSTGQTGLREALNSRKCGLEIGNQIGRMFEADRHAHQAVPHIHHPADAIAFTQRVQYTGAKYKVELIYVQR